jgi:hypothetical protein
MPSGINKTGFYIKAKEDPRTKIPKQISSPKVKLLLVTSFI